MIIGRNEGARLVHCLDSLASQWPTCVYVDSGSTDDSVHEAEKRGVAVLRLDMSIPFTAARARNAGARRLIDMVPELRYLQFVDGDCELSPSWISSATRFLEERPEVGVVFGTQRERAPRESTYNKLFDLEWDTPLGSVKSCAGNAFYRRQLFESVGGFREDLIAGEEPELCVRLRRTGALIWHIDLPMSVHDAHMHHFRQWWRRAKRGGHAFAEGAALHGGPPERHFVRETRSIFLWGFAVPAFVLIMALAFSPWWLLAAAVYPLQMLRVALRSKWSWRENLLYGVFVITAKFPEFAGVLTYHWRHFRHIPRRLIEYK